jgi:hypothetical protein
METLGTAESKALRRIAKVFRTSAAETDLATYSIKMNNAANDLDDQALQIETAEAASRAALGR